MSKIKSGIMSVQRKLKYRTVEFNTDLYEPLLAKINNVDLKYLGDNELKNLSTELIHKARSGEPLNNLLVTAFALVREASQRVLKMRHFDVQITAGIAMHFGRLVEMQTGEGKTLTAVLPAYLNALTGKGVHIMTFNDYLARRDAEWMGPLYRFLGLSAAHISEGMSTVERQMAYNCDITYLTAKEAGFDYLKGFLCYSEEELVHRDFNFAIIDEADSILIDEARIPLVIAGESDNEKLSPAEMAEIVDELDSGTDYETDEYQRNVFLTDVGLSKAENALKCGNLYDPGNLNLLVGINNALHAKVLLKRDVDYIIADGQIELVDEFTGRVAEKRHWPYGLHEAIEAKEKIAAKANGHIIASITLQNYIGLYKRICGMTGTALSAADEFAEFYNLKVVVIPTNKPCIRADHPDIIFTDKEAKHKALVAEIARTHKNGRPILVGTCSVEESEELAEKLRNSGIQCNVLNAKNDEMEANIIAEAGSYGAVTVSTNMAGRGTDIKLGGKNEADRERVTALGGLYVLGTNRHESRRVDNQLRGRSGRQGDPGDTRFYISLEDDLMVRYRLKDIIPKSFYQNNSSSPIDSPILKKQILNAQKIIEGQNFDIRRTLTKYSVIIERQRRMIHQWRQELLLNIAVPQLMAVYLKERFDLLASHVGIGALIKAEKQVTLFYINKCWADYIDYMSYIRESIHLVNIGGKVPIDEFNKTAVESFEILKKEIIEEIIGVLAAAEITADGINMEKHGLKRPSSTWTYLVDDRPEQCGINTVVANPLVAAINLPLWTILGLYNRFFKKHQN